MLVENNDKPQLSVVPDPMPEKPSYVITLSKTAVRIVVSVLGGALVSTVIGALIWYGKIQKQHEFESKRVTSLELEIKKPSRAINRVVALEKQVERLTRMMVGHLDGKNGYHEVLKTDLAKHKEHVTALDEWIGNVEQEHYKLNKGMVDHLDTKTGYHEALRVRVKALERTVALLERLLK